jgi:hypothetical protein
MDLHVTCCESEAMLEEKLQNFIQDIKVVLIFHAQHFPCNVTMGLHTKLLRLFLLVQIDSGV